MVGLNLKTSLNQMQYSKLLLCIQSALCHIHSSILINTTWFLLILNNRKLCYHFILQFSRSVVSDSLRPHEPQYARPPCPSTIPRVYPNSCPLSWWCHLTISSSVVPFSSSLQSFPTSGSFQMSQHFASDGQNIGVSASTSVLPMNSQDWSPLGWTGWISLQSKGLSRVFSKHCAKPFIGIISFNL